MFAMTLYDSVYLYLKVASDVLRDGGNKSSITNGRFMRIRAQNFGTESGKRSYFAVAVNR